MTCLLILGNQLFDPRLFPRALKPSETLVFMREDRELCTYFRFHRHKIVFFLAAMREYATELAERGFEVHYEALDSTADETPYEQSLTKFLKKHGISRVVHFEIEDRFFETRLAQSLIRGGALVETLPSPMFLTTRPEFRDYLARSKRPFMKTFYEKRRQDLKILITKSGEPVGGQWSFDAENRLALPKGLTPPELPRAAAATSLPAVQALTTRLFKDHPGAAEDFWLPVTRSEARGWLDDFLAERLAEFGPYEDALPAESDFVYHSVLTPFLNCGLLTPREVVDKTLAHAAKHKTPIASLEGFLRQIIGWREFIRGIYQNFDDRQSSGNFFNHRRRLSEAWYTGKTSLPQLRRTLEKTLRRAYCHHIERLMVLGNLMLLLEIHPREAHRWFMEMFIDSSDWVMGPNVYGMALFSDGGLFATKPYICGSNYWRKMSREPKGDWCDGLDGLYWRFIERNKAFFAKNPRLSMMAKTLDKMPDTRRRLIYSAADRLQRELTVDP
jgi:deoxyribodipyrimidine photolyase-related protein